MTSETKWTPGPWEIDPTTRHSEICTIYNLPTMPTEDGMGQGWAYIRGAIGYFPADAEEMLANAHLIAAAPRLYDELVQAKEALLALGFVPASERIEQIDATLAAARGEQ